MGNLRAPGVVIAIGSDNQKTGKVNSLYVTLKACPDTCVLGRLGACYAKQGHVGFTTRRLDGQVEDGHAAVLNAAALVDAVNTPGIPLRLFVSGDQHCAECAAVLADAARRYQARNNAPAWGYTHRWREIPANVWAGVSVLASCETDEDVRNARARGWAVARVFPEFPSERAFERAGERYIPCPQQTGRAADCNACRLCTRHDVLQKRAIAFRAHGTRERALREYLISLE